MKPCRYWKVIDMPVDDLPCVKLKHLGAQMLQEKLSKMTEEERRAFWDKANAEFVKKNEAARKALLKKQKSKK